MSERASSREARPDGGPPGSAASSKATKLWLRYIGPNDSDGKVLVNKRCMTFDLRKKIGAMIGVNPRHLVLKIDGTELLEARVLPLMDLDVSKQVVHWSWGDRLLAIREKRKLPTLNSLDQFERSLVHFAVIDGDSGLAKDVLNHKDFDNRLVDRCDIFGDTGLTLAAIQGYADLVELLVDRQAQVERRNIYGRTPLMLAAEHGHSDTVKALLRAGASPMLEPETMKPHPMDLARLNKRGGVIRTIRQHQKEEADAAAALEGRGDDKTMPINPVAITGPENPVTITVPESAKVELGKEGGETSAESTAETAQAEEEASAASPGAPAVDASP